MKTFSFMILLFLSPWALPNEGGLPDSELPEEVKILALHFPPYMDLESEGGMAINFLRIVFQKMGIKPKFVFLPPKRAMQAFYAGEGLLVSSFGTFSEGDYTMIRLAMLRAGLYQVHGTNERNITGYLRGVTRGKEVIEKHGSVPVAVTNYEAGFKMLIKKRISLFLAQNLHLNFLVKNKFPEAAHELKIQRRGVYSEPGGLIAGPKQKALLKRIKAFISTEEMRLIYREQVKDDLAPYLGSYELEDYIWDDFSLIELKDNVINVSI